MEQRFLGCLVGLAVGDAVGTTVEFAQRGSFEPVTGMVGGGPFHLPADAWTDDARMWRYTVDKYTDPAPGRAS